MDEQATSNLPWSQHNNEWSKHYYSPTCSLYKVLIYFPTLMGLVYLPLRSRRRYSSSMTIILVWKLCGSWLLHLFLVFIYYKIYNLNILNFTYEILIASSIPIKCGKVIFNFYMLNRMGVVFYMRFVGKFFIFLTI